MCRSTIRGVVVRENYHYNLDMNIHLTGGGLKEEGENRTEKNLTDFEHKPPQ